MDVRIPKFSRSLASLCADLRRALGYYATSYSIVSLGTLTGTPIAGAIVTANNGAYWGTSHCLFRRLDQDIDYASPYQPWLMC